MALGSRASSAGCWRWPRSWRSPLPGGATGGDDAVRAVPQPAGLDHGAGRARRRLGHAPRARSRPPRATRSSTTASRSSTSRARAARSGSPQLVSKDSGDPYQLMMTGLVMLGAIETNRSDVALDAHDADRHDDHRDRGDRRAGEVEVPHAEGPHRRLRARPRLRPLGGRLGRQHRPAPASASSRACSAPTRRKTKYVAHSGGGEANAAILSGSVDAGVDRAVGGRRPGRGRQDAPARGLLAGRRRDRRLASRRRSRTRASTSR